MKRVPYLTVKHIHTESIPPKFTLVVDGFDMSGWLAVHRKYGN
jgi:hypothetical protein